MTEAVATGGQEANSVANKSVSAAAMFWFAVAMLGQDRQSHSGTEQPTRSLALWIRSRGQRG